MLEAIRILTPDGQQAAHQQKKNFIKSLYQLASALLDLNRAGESLSTLKRCLSEDERSNHFMRGLPGTGGAYRHRRGAAGRWIQGGPRLEEFQFL